MKLSIPTRDGSRLGVQVRGRGRPVVLLHGFGSRGSHWLPNVLPLAHRYRFVLPDLRGFGDSHDVSFPDTDVFTTYARDVEDVLDHLGLDQVVLGGVSMGAYTALKLNERGSFSRVAKYVHIDQSPRLCNDATWRHGLFGEDQERMFDTFRRLLSLAERAGLETDYWNLPMDVRFEMRRATAEFFCYATNSRIRQVSIRRLVHRAERLVTRTVMPVRRWSSYLTIMRAYMDEADSVNAALGDIRIPTTLMIGMRSRMYPPEGQLAMTRAIRHARVVRFARSGHVPMMDEPLKFQRALAAFLAESHG
jgi:pimeloyl-ACP methyl ester carboxylesterase